MTVLPVTEAELPMLATAQKKLQVLEQQVVDRAKDYARIMRLNFPHGGEATVFERIYKTTIDTEALYGGGHIVPVTLQWEDGRAGGLPHTTTVDLPRQFLFDQDGTFTKQVEAYAQTR